MTEEESQNYRSQRLTSVTAKHIPIASTIKGYLDGRADGFVNGTKWLESEHEGASGIELVINPYEAGYQLGIGRELRSRGSKTIDYHNRTYEELDQQNFSQSQD